MADAHRPKLFTVPLGTSLTDALAAHLLKVGAETLPDTLILMPNNRAIKSLTESFVRAAKTGLLLPSMVAVGDLALDEALGTMFDPIGGAGAEPILPAIPEIERRILLTTLIQKQRLGISQVEALKLAKHLAAAIDVLEIEEVSLDRVRNDTLKDDMQAHWQSAYADFLSISVAFQAELAERKQNSAAHRRNILLDRFALSLPAAGPVIAAGITTAAPAIARLLKAVSRLPDGMLVWPHLDLDISDDEWDALGPNPREGGADQAEETHPYFHLKLLFDRMGIRRDEIALFPGIQQKTALNAVDRIFARAESVLNWAELPPAEKRLKHVRVMTAADSSEEALAIAILIRESLETAGKRIALVTPDRELAVRVSAQLRRWDIRIDDSAGQPLIQLIPATLLLNLAEMVADHAGPVTLLATLKHPLVRFGDERLAWLESVRQLDLAIRGPRLGIGLSAIADAITAGDASEKPNSAVLAWWATLAPVFAAFDALDNADLPTILDALISVATELTGGKIWQGQAGRQLAQLLEDYRATDLSKLGIIERGSIPALLTKLLDSEVTRPVFGSNPRVAIYGLLEARLQQADFVICAGLNEGTWPQMPQPDPWLAPGLRRALKLPGLERNMGLSAHDLMSLLGTQEVVLSRALRDRGGPTVASRFLLRTQALVGSQLLQEKAAIARARLIDVGTPVPQFDRPAPMPSKEQRRVDISVTQADVLKADPYAFYARNILQLKPLDSVGGEPNSAWRGTAIHDILEKWAKEDKYDPDKLAARAGQMLSDPAFHPAVRVLWQPRVTSGLSWIARETLAMRDAGRVIISTESWGKLTLAGVEIKGRADRIDRNIDGSLVILDYKSGQPPSPKSVKAGYRMQLGLIGAMAEAGGVENVRGTALGFEYWSLGKNKDRSFGFIKKPVTEKNGENVEFIPLSLKFAREAIENWITGTAPFTAKLKPEYAPYSDYDQLMRYQEWYGRLESADVD